MDEEVRTLPRQLRSVTAGTETGPGPILRTLRDHDSGRTGPREVTETALGVVVDGRGDVLPTGEITVESGGSRVSRGGFRR